MKLTSIVASDVDRIIEDVTPELLLSKLKDSSFLVAGATGMVGSYFIYVLDKLNQEYNANIKIYACLRNVKKLDESLIGKVQVVEQDVTEPFSLSGIDYILHAASPASPLIMREHPLETNYANTLGTANLLKLKIDSPERGAILFVSSREIYGEPFPGQEFFTEGGPLGQVDHLVPRNGYAEGKKAAENMLVSANAEYGVNSKIVRLAHTYGPGMSIYDGRVQADFLKNIMNKEDIVLKSDGSSVRTYTYISDAITAMFIVLLKSNDTVYHNSDDQSKASIKHVADKPIDLPVSKDNGLKLVFDIDEESKKGASSFTCGILSSDKIRNELFWVPRYSIEEGFERTIKHLQEELL